MAPKGAGTAAAKAAERLGLFKAAEGFFKKTIRFARELPQEPKRIMNRFAHGPEHDLTDVERSRFFHMAEQARDSGISAIPKKERRAVATATGGVNIRTGETAFGRSSNPFGCAEDDVVRQLGGNPDEILFSTAARPRNGRQVGICRRCQVTFRRSQFGPGTRFEKIWR